MRKSRVSYKRQKAINSPIPINGPSWLIKSLAWAAIIGGVSWVGYIQGGLDGVKLVDKNQDISIATHEEKEKALNEKIDTNLMYIHESLNRIEARLNKGEK